MKAVCIPVRVSALLLWLYVVLESIGKQPARSDTPIDTVTIIEEISARTEAILKANIGNAVFATASAKRLIATNNLVIYKDLEGISRLESASTVQLHPYIKGIPELGGIRVCLDSGDYYGYMKWSDNRTLLGYAYIESSYDNETNLLYADRYSTSVNGTKAGERLHRHEFNCTETQLYNPQVLRRNVGPAFWVAPYFDDVSGEPLVSFSNPIMDAQQNRIGSVFADLFLYDISAFFASAFSSVPEYSAFLFTYESGNLLGTSLSDVDLYSVDPDTQERSFIPVYESENPLISGTTSTLQSYDLPAGTPIIYNYNGDRRLHLQPLFMSNARAYVLMESPDNAIKDDITAEEFSTRYKISMTLTCVTILWVGAHLIFLIWYRNNRFVRVSLPQYLYVLLPGYLILLTYNFAISVKASGGICTARLMIVVVGTSVILIPLICRSLQVYVLVNWDVQRKASAMRYFTVRMIYLYAFIYIAVSALFYILVSSQLDPSPFYITTSRETQYGAYEEYQVCTLQTRDPLTAHVFFHFMLLSVAVLLCMYHGRRLKDELTNARMVLFALCNSFVIQIVVLVGTLFSMDSYRHTTYSYSDIKYVHSLSICLLAAVNTAILVTPMAYLIATGGTNTAAEGLLEVIRDKKSSLNSQEEGLMMQSADEGKDANLSQKLREVRFSCSVSVDGIMYRAHHPERSLSGGVYGVRRGVRSSVNTSDKASSVALRNEDFKDAFVFLQSFLDRKPRTSRKSVIEDGDDGEHCGNVDMDVCRECEPFEIGEIGFEDMQGHAVATRKEASPWDGIEESKTNFLRHISDPTNFRGDLRTGISSPARPVVDDTRSNSSSNSSRGMYSGIHSGKYSSTDSNTNKESSLRNGETSSLEKP